MGHEWSVCPFGEMRDPIWRGAVWVSRLVDAGLIANVAHEWSAGVSMAIVALRAAQAERRAAEEAERLAELRRG